jgi:hypothetical protein
LIWIISRDVPHPPGKKSALTGQPGCEATTALPVLIARSPILIARLQVLIGSLAV